VEYKELYSNEIYLGDYSIEWVDQKLVVTCCCTGSPSIEVFSDSYSTCDTCGRRYSILELIKVETPVSQDTGHEKEFEIEKAAFVELVEQQHSKGQR